MKKLLSSLFLALLLANPVFSAAPDTHPQVKMETNMGTIVLELDTVKAPLTVANFLNYIQQGFYDGTIFHRVIEDFMIQGGGFTETYERKQTNPPILNEANNGLKNVRGSIAMARTFDPHSATAQFFINVKDNYPLDHRHKSPSGWGYTVFGKVIKGMDVVDKIRAVRTGPGGPFPTDAPLKAVVINKVELIIKKAN